MILPMLLLALAADCPAEDPTGAIPGDAENYPVTEPVEPGWCREGIDLYAATGPRSTPLAKLEVVNEGGERASNWYQPEPWQAPAGWVPLATREARAPDNGAFHDILIQYHQGWVEVTPNPAWRVGNAVCSTETGPTYAYRTDPAAELEAVRREAAVRLGDPPTADPATPCVTVIRDGEGGYRLRFHDSQGRSAEDVDDFYEGAEVRIVPR
ncbi:hypothetical protein [Sphingomonas sp.]|uniref:hypothetical protein n=1 Tax=Sphingomonas sp. TaxID=28214 RepID=UPI001B029A44|nr:hypothetical protein [Sphingomonas sp.]MBO9711308.1 hypothetical protein [Sphingomonas sp.]